MKNRWVALHLVLFLSGCASRSPLIVSADSTPSFEISIISKFGSFKDAVAVSQDNFGNVYVLDAGRPGVIKFNSQGDSVESVIGFGRGGAEFDHPSDIDASLTNSILVSDLGNDRIIAFTKELAPQFVLKSQSDERNPSFGLPLAVSTDDAARIYTIDGKNRRVLQYSSQRTFEREIGGYSAASGSGRLTNPRDIAIDRDENLAVLDQNGTVIYRFDRFGNLLERRELASAAKRISSSDDTLFAVTTDKITRYLVKGMVAQSIYLLKNLEATDFSARRGRYVLLAKDACYFVTLAQPK